MYWHTVESPGPLVVRMWPQWLDPVLGSAGITSVLLCALVYRFEYFQASIKPEHHQFLLVEGAQFSKEMCS